MEFLVGNEMINLLFAAVGGGLGWWFRSRGGGGDDSPQIDNPMLKLFAERLREKSEQEEREENEKKLDELITTLKN